MESFENLNVYIKQVHRLNVAKYRVTPNLTESIMQEMYFILFLDILEAGR